MLLSFERGSASEPKGHALAYLRNAASPDEVYATYLIVPPISIDLAKYMPPMFASKISLADVESVSAIPLPPVPEKIQSVEYLHRLAESRGDDVVSLGTVDASDVQRLLAHVAEAAQEYLHAYTTYVETAPAPEPPRAALSVSVDEVMYSLMNERDKLGELAKLVGKLRYAVDGSDQSQVKEAVSEFEALARYLPEKYRVGQIAAAAQRAGDKGSKLSELHVTRCYKLCDEDYGAVEELDSRIRELETLP